MTNWIHYIFNCRRPLSTKLSKVVTYRERLPISESNEALTKWPTSDHVTSWTKIYPLLQDLWPLNLVDCWLQGGGSERKCLSRLGLLLNYINYWKIMFRLTFRFYFTTFMKVFLVILIGQIFSINFLIVYTNCYTQTYVLSFFVIIVPICNTFHTL